MSETELSNSHYFGSFNDRLSGRDFGYSKQISFKDVFERLEQVLLSTEPLQGITMYTNIRIVRD